MKRYTKSEDEKIKKWSGVKSWQEIADNLGRTSHGVRSRAKKLGVEGGYRRPNKKTVNKLREKGFIPQEDITSTGKKFIFQCPSCQQNFKAIPSNLARNSVTSCGCIKQGKRTGTENIPGIYFAKLKVRARNAGYNFDIDVDYIDQLLIKQQFKCALSGLTISLSYDPKKPQTASLDRIDSLGGYTKDNVQWLHKDINMMKRDFSTTKFIELCRLVSNVT